jgi:hypothetical protein
MEQHVFKRIYLNPKCSVCNLLPSFFGFQSEIDIITGISMEWAIWAFMGCPAVEHTFKYYHII